MSSIADHWSVSSDLIVVVWAIECRLLEGVITMQLARSLLERDFKEAKEVLDQTTTHSLSLKESSIFKWGLEISGARQTMWHGENSTHVAIACYNNQLMIRVHPISTSYFDAE
jgi:hypothetical protein